MQSTSTIMLGSNSTYNAVTLTLLTALKIVHIKDMKLHHPKIIFNNINNVALLMNSKIAQYATIAMEEFIMGVMVILRTIFLY